MILISSRMKSIILSFSFLISFVYSNPEHNKLNRSQVIDIFSESFLDSNNDFIMPMLRSHFFPLSLSKERNIEEDRDNYEHINDEEEAERLTEQLQIWRGFQNLDDINATEVVNEFLDMSMSLSASITSKFEDNDKIEGSDLKNIPEEWLELLDSNDVDVEKSIDSLAEIYTSNPLNAAYLYKIVTLLRDSNDAKRNVFLSKVDIPNYFKEQVGYLIGYRWNVDSETSLPADRLISLPADIIINMEVESDNMDRLKQLRNAEIFAVAEQWKKNAWFHRIHENLTWEGIVGTVGNLEKYGHLLSGASLEHLVKLETEDNVNEDALEKVFKDQKFSPSRTQVIWEAVKLEDREALFTTKAAELDVSQLLSHYLSSASDVFSTEDHKEAFEAAWFSSSKISTPWVNMMLIGLKAMIDDHLSSWTIEDIKNYGKFVKILSAGEIEKLGMDSGDFTQDVVSAVVSSSLSLPQLTAIYKRYKQQMSSEEHVMEPVHPILFSALSSADLLSSTPRFIWSEDKDNILMRSALFTPGQMRALHEIMIPGMWRTFNMSSILTTHAACLSEVIPGHMRSNLEKVLDGIKTAGYHEFYNIAAKIQMIPRHLKMAWLETALHDQESIATEILLDKLTEDTTPNVTINNPDSTHPLSVVFDRWISPLETNLTSFALAGISCHQIMMTKSSDFMEIFAMYRYQMDMSGKSMPSSTRKCWAKKLREYLVFKSKIYNITVNTETELLSLLNTADIKTVGGELLLTWGGTVLSSIVNPEVTHEVLMEVALTEPYVFLSNGVKYSCLKEMARTLLKMMLHHEQGKTDFMVVTHVHNLLPYTDTSILEAEAEHLKLWFRTVLDTHDRTVCLKKDERENMRNVLLKAYGQPAGWNSLDLVEMGDMLIVMRATDLAEVRPTSLRMAAAELVTNTRYSDMVTEVRHSTRPELYHEACLRWLGDNEGMESEEALTYHHQWKLYNHFIVVGNFLQFELFASSVSSVPRPRSDNGFGNGRRKRQAETSFDFRDIYSRVMGILGTKHAANELTNEQKSEATNIITSTQTLLADTSFAVLGLERGDKTSEEILAVLSEYRNTGNMTEEQGARIQQLATETQIRMIQKMSPLIGLTHIDLGVTPEQYNWILEYETFTTPAPPTTSTTLTVSTEELLVTSSTTTSTTSSTTEEENTEGSSNEVTTPALVEETTSEVETEVSWPEKSNQTPESEATTESVSSTESSTPTTTTLPDNFREGRDEVIEDSEQISTTASSTQSSTEGIVTESLSTTSDVVVTDAPVTVSSSTLSAAEESQSSSTAGSDVTTENESTNAPTDTESTTVSTATESTADSTSVADTNVEVDTVTSEETTSAPLTTETSSQDTTAAPKVTTTMTDDELSDLIASNELLLLSTFTHHEPETDNFDRIPALDTVILTCDVLTASGPAAGSISASHVSSMNSSDLVNCLETLGNIPWSRGTTSAIWRAIRDKLGVFQDASLKPIKRDMMLQLNNLLPAVVRDNQDLIDVSEDNIDGLSIIGKIMDAEDPTEVLMQRYLTENRKTEDSPLSGTEAASLRQLLCGLTPDQWRTHVTQHNIPVLVTDYLSTLQCSVSSDTASHLTTLLTSDNLYGSPGNWTTSDVLSLGWLVSVLTPDHLSTIPDHALEGLTGAAAKYFTGHQWMSLTEGQLSYLSPHAASFISVDKLMSVKTMSKIREIRAAVGEAPSVVEEMKKMMEDMMGQTQDDDSSAMSSQPSIMIMCIFILAKLVLY